MSLDSSFLETIENPNSEELKSLLKKAKNNIKNKLKDKGYSTTNDLVNSSSYTYYHNFEKENPQFAFIVQNPGILKNRHEIKDIKNTKTPEGRINIYQKYGSDWLKESNHFSEKFFKILHRYGLIYARDWRRYITNRFYRDFYLTDLIKYRVKTKHIKEKHCEKAFNEQLKY